MWKKRTNRARRENQNAREDYVLVGESLQFLPYKHKSSMYCILFRRRFKNSHFILQLLKGSSFNIFSQLTSTSTPT